MYHVSTVHLSPDAAQADAAFGTVDRAEMTADELTALLDRFALVDAVENQTAEPFVIVTGRSGKFHVRTGRGKLYLYNARASVEPYAELTSTEIIAQLERDSVTAAPFSVATDTPSAEPARPPPAPHRAIAAAILAAGVALNGYTLYSVFYTEKVNERPPLTLIIDQAEASARGREIVGTYATGDRPGDRIITIKTDGRVQFSEIGVKAGVAENADTFRLGRRGTRLCLSTVDSGVIDVVNLETLAYYGDTYRRR